MTIVFGIGFVVELALSMYLLKVVHRHEWDIYNRELKIEVLQHDIDTYNESIKVLSGSVRKLNEVVKDLEQKHPKIETKNRMNTRAFIAGWDADESEVEESVKKHIVDICLNGTYEQKHGLIDAMILQCALLGQTQQCIYPCQPLQSGQLQSSAMPLQQCIYPCQQTPTGAILPLWYMNRNLENM